MADRSEQEAGANVPEQAPDYESETVEQLEARLAAGEGIIRNEDPEPEPEPEPDPEPEAPEEEEEELPPAAEADQGEPEGDDFDERQSLIEELQLQLEKERINAAKLQDLQSRDAGMVGHLKKEMEALKAALSQPQQQQTEEDWAEPQGQPRQRVEPGNDALQSRLAELENTARAGAVEGEYESFIAAKGLDQSKASEFLKAMGSSIAEQWEPYRNQMGSMGVQAIKKSLRFVLDSAYADYRIADLKARREEAMARKASQVPERKKAKLASATAGSASVSGAPGGPKKPSDMTAEEADAELLRQFGTHARSGRIRML